MGMGTPRLLISSPYFDQSYMIFGTNDSLGVFGHSFKLSSLDGTLGFTINGLSSGDRFGSSFSIEGDLNGDGYSDVAISAKTADSNNIAETGQCYVLFGTNDTISIFGALFNVSSLDGINGFTINGKAEGDLLGRFINIGGDFNADGYSDLLIGAPKANANNVEKSGQSYLLFGVSNPLVVFGMSFELSSLDGKNGFEINGTKDKDLSGFSGNIGGDFNGDGYSDLFIGAFKASTNDFILSGQGYILFGLNETSTRYGRSFNLSSLDGTNGLIISVMAEGYRLGYSGNIKGDFNEDGYTDLVISALGRHQQTPGQVCFLTLPTFCDAATYLQPYPDNSTCETCCPQGWWLNVVNRTCDICYPLCATCLGPEQNSCTTCTPEYYFDAASSTCLSHSQLFELIKENEAALLTPSSTSSCPSCSDHGHCELFDQYNEVRCICESGYVGASCSLTELDVEEFLNKKSALLSIINVILSTADTHDQEYALLSSYLRGLIEEPATSDQALLNMTMQLARDMTSIAQDDNYSDQLVNEVLNNLLDVSTSSLRILHHTDCLLEGRNTRELYNQSISLVQQIGSANNASGRKSASGSGILENEYISIYSNTMTLRQLSEVQTTVTQQGELPAFLLQYEDALGSDFVNMEEGS